MSASQDLVRRVAALAARHARAEARARVRERGVSLRRKILVGAVVIAGWPDGEPPAAWRAALDHYLTRPHDRLLFRLGDAEDRRPYSPP